MDAGTWRCEKLHTLPSLSTPGTADTPSLSTRGRGREVLAPPLTTSSCLSVSTGLVQYSLSADPQRPAAGDEPQELCSDHRGGRSASVRESHFPGEYGGSALGVPGVENAVVARREGLSGPLPRPRLCDTGVADVTPGLTRPSPSFHSQQLSRGLGEYFPLPGPERVSDPHSLVGRGTFLRIPPCTGRELSVA